MMRHKKFHKKLSRDTSCRLSLVKNNTIHLINYRAIKTTKPKSHSILSFANRFFSRLLKKKDIVNVIRYSKHALSCHNKDTLNNLIKFYNDNKDCKKSNYISKKKLLIRRSDSAIIMHLKMLA